MIILDMKDALTRHTTHGDKNKLNCCEVNVEIYIIIIIPKKQTPARFRLNYNYPMVDSLYGLKLFVTKRSTSDDFPTPVSPSNTTLTSRGFVSVIIIFIYDKRNKRIKNRH